MTENTYAYFSSRAIISGNYFQVGELNNRILKNDLKEEKNGNEKSLEKEIKRINTGTIDFQYDMEVVTSGDGCNLLSVKVKRNDSKKYEGPLEEITLEYPITLRAREEEKWNFYLTYLKEDINESKECSFHIEFRSWQTNLSWGEGFSMMSSTSDIVLELEGERVESMEISERESDKVEEKEIKNEDNESESKEEKDKERLEEKNKDSGDDKKDINLEKDYEESEREDDKEEKIKDEDGYNDKEDNSLEKEEMDIKEEEEDDKLEDKKEEPSDKEL